MIGSSPMVTRGVASPVWSVAGKAMRGRNQEWHVVDELLQRARRGLGGVLLVDGEWGIGKTLLLCEAAGKAASQGFSLATGAADQLGRIVPFFALLGALRGPLDEPAAEHPHPDSPDAKAWRINQLQARLEERAAIAPVLVSLDDLQWASSATLLALRILPRELARSPVAWILARSTAGRERGAELLFSVLERGGSARITLAPLTDDAVSGVLADGLGAPPDRELLAMASGAAGNPSLLTELMRGLRDDRLVQVTEGHARLLSAQLPQRVHVVAQKRLDGLGKRTRHLLQTAAVLGRSFRLEDATEMLGETPAALLPAVEEAVDAGIVAPGEDAFSFRHMFMWHAAAHMIPLPARKALHRQFGEILLNRGDSAESAAAHLLQAAHAGDPAMLGRLDRAATEILHSSPQTAADLALRALELTRPTDPGALSRSVAAAEALTAAGRLERAAGIVHGVLAQPLQPGQEARLRCLLSSILCMGGQMYDAEREAGAVLAQPQLPQGVREQALTVQFQVVAGLCDNDAAGRLVAAILAAPDEYGQPVVAAALVVRAMISWDEGQIGEGLEFLRDAARHGNGVSADARHWQPLLVLAARLVDVRQFDEAAAIIQAPDIETLDGIPSQVVPVVLRARMHLAMGRLDDATAEGETALATAKALAAHSYASVAHCVLGVVALRRGDLEAATHHIASRSVRMPNFADVYARTETSLAEAQIDEAREGPAASIDQIRQFCADLPARRGMLLGEPATSAWLVRAALAAGDQTLPVRVARLAGALARDNPDFPAVTAAAAHSVGLLRQDPALLAQAVAQHPDAWARASAAEDLGVLLARQANENQAVQRMGDALDGYRLSGAATDLARIRRRLRRLGVRRRHWASSVQKPTVGWESLTETERATSELVARGLNNRQVADRMYVSVHTVAFHLRQIFRKLNVSSRVELTRVVFDKAEQPGPGGTSSEAARWVPAPARQR